jgi:hypothetical protein
MHEASIYIRRLFLTKAMRKGRIVQNKAAMQGNAIDGGDEGVLLTIAVLAASYARRRSLAVLDCRVSRAQLRPAQLQAAACA